LVFRDATAVFPRGVGYPQHRAPSSVASTDAVVSELRQIREVVTHVFEGLHRFVEHLARSDPGLRSLAHESDVGDNGTAADDGAARDGSGNLFMSGGLGVADEFVDRIRTDGEAEGDEGADDLVRDQRSN